MNNRTIIVRRTSTEIYLNQPAGITENFLIEPSNYGIMIIHSFATAHFYIFIYIYFLILRFISFYFLYIKKLILLDL